MIDNLISGVIMTGFEIEVLRLGHRMGRDPRITTHLALVSRAMGANSFVLAGDEDQKLFSNIHSVNERFGHGLSCRYEKSPMRMLREIANSDEESKPIIIHLTMYGEPFKEVIPNIPKDKRVVVVVGGAKVPGELFKISDFNIAVGNQPHSEVAALALFLDSWTDGEGFNREFSEPQLVISPSKSGKDVKEVL
jgi:tRNA (cytidine56-2'-O)-methyltransferase